MTQVTSLHSIFAVFRKYPLSSQFLLAMHDMYVCVCICIHTYISNPIFKISPKVKNKKNKKQNPAAKYYDIPVSKHKTEHFTKMNKIYHMHSASTL